jgi:hypothetical protein
MITSMGRPEARMVGQQIQAAVLLHIDIQQHQIDLQSGSLIISWPYSA